MKCPKCDNEILDGATFCNKCGASLQDASEKNKQMPKKKNGKIILIVILLVLFVVIGVTVGFIVVKNVNEGGRTNPEAVQSKAKSPEKEEEKEEKKDDDSYGIDKKIHKTIDASKVNYKMENDLANDFEIVKIIYNENKKYLQVLAKSNSKTPLSYRAYLNYYNNDGTRIDKTSDTGYVDPGKLFVFNFYNSTEEEFNSVDLTVSADTYKTTYHPVEFNKNSFSTADIEDSLHIYYKNDTKNNLTGAFVGVFYKNNEIVYFDKFSFFDIAPGATSENKVYLVSFPNFVSGNMKSEDYYDKYEVSISYLYNFEDDY